MKHFTMKKWAKTMLCLWALLFGALPVSAQESDRHELEHLHVTIKAGEYKRSKFIEKEIIKGKEYIKGKASSYNKSGEANAGILLQPNAEYLIKSKMPGGAYQVTVYYALDKEQAPENPRISIGMNTQEPQHIEIKNKLVNSVKTSFKVKFLKGNKHTVKIWLPSAGVKVREVRITRALLPQKSGDTKKQ